MSDQHDPTEVRRKFLKLLGGSVVLIPLTGLHGCSGEKEPSPSTSTPKADPAPAPKPKTAPPPKPEPVPQTAPAASDDPLPQLTESDPQAAALGYRLDASQVDASKFPRFAAGQTCKNCTLYLGKGDEEWAGCSLFPGKAVNANGWCSAYVPKA